MFFCKQTKYQFDCATTSALWSSKARQFSFRLDEGLRFQFSIWFCFVCEQSHFSTRKLIGNLVLSCNVVTSFTTSHFADSMGSQEGKPIKFDETRWCGISNLTILTLSLFFIRQQAALLLNKGGLHASFDALTCFQPVARGVMSSCQFQKQVSRFLLNFLKWESYRQHGKRERETWRGGNK